MCAIMDQGEYRQKRIFDKNYINFLYRGNVREEKPYMTGKPSCNAFGMKFSKKYAGLCYN